LCPAVAPVEVSNPLICAGCKQLVSIAHNFLVANSTEQKIIEAVEKACNYFPEQYKGLCMIVVEQYGRQIVEQLANKVLEPNAVCTAVKACPTKLKTYKQMFISKLANGKL
jgi:saposin